MAWAFNGFEKGRPDGGCRQSSVTSLTRPRLGYPLLGCFPAASNSVPPSKGEYSKIAWQMKEEMKEDKYTAAKFPVMDVVVTGT